MTKNENENYLDFIKRVTQAYTDGLIDSVDWTMSLIGEQPYGPENLRRCSKYLQKVLDKLDREEFSQIKAESTPEQLRKLQQLQEEIVKERKKMQWENARIQETYRYQARNDLFDEKVVEAIKNLTPLSCVDKPPRKPVPDDVGRTGLLVLSDLHAGSTFEIKDNQGRIINSYNMDVLRNRLEQICDQVAFEANIMEYNNLKVVICGDLLENILRLTSLTKLKDPVIDTTIQLGEILANWLDKLSYVLDYLPIHVYVISGNHDSLAILGSKPRFDEENLAKLVVKFLELRLASSPCIDIEPYGETAVVDIEGTNVLFEHGEDRDLKTTIDYYSNIYNIKIDEIMAGHLHCPESKAIGLSDLGDRMIYRVGSLVGTDPYAKKIRAAAKPSCYFAVYQAGVGHTWSRTYYLK